MAMTVLAVKAGRTTHRTHDCRGPLRQSLYIDLLRIVKSLFCFTT